MISQQLLTAKGSIEALIALTQSGSLSNATLADEMDVAEGTARSRLTDLADAGLVTEAAELREERPVRVYAVTDSGEQLANSLQSIIDDYGQTDSDGTVEVPTGEEEPAESNAE